MGLKEMGSEIKMTLVWGQGAEETRKHWSIMHVVVSKEKSRGHVELQRKGWRCSNAILIIAFFWNNSLKALISPPLSPFSTPLNNTHPFWSDVLIANIL